MDYIDILCNTIKKPFKLPCLCDSPEYKVLFSAVAKWTAVELQKYRTKGQISSTILIQLTFPIQFTS